MPLALLLYAVLVVRSGVALAGDEFMDLPSFHEAARSVFRDGESPYTTTFLEQAGTETGHAVFPYLYPPPSLLFVLPLAPLSHTGAAVALLVVNHLCMWLILWLVLLRILRLPLRHPALWLAAAWFFVFDPLVETIRLGQVNLIVLALLCVTWDLLRRRAAAGLVAAPLAASILLKLYPAIFIPYLALRRPAAATWSLLFVGLGSFLSWLVLPGSVWTDWLSNVAPTGGLTETPFGLFSPASPHNQSLAGLMARLFLDSEFGPAPFPAPGLARTLAYALAGTILLISFATVLRDRAGRAGGTEMEEAEARRTDLEMGLLLTAMPLAAPITWNHHLALLFPVLLVSARALTTGQGSRVGTLTLILAATVLSVRLPVWRPVLREGVLLLAISAKMYAVILLWGWLVARLWRRRWRGL